MTGLLTEMQRVVAEVIDDEPQAAKVVFALIQNFGGERLYLPHNNYDARNHEIRELYQTGATISQLTKRYRLSRSTLYRIINDEP